MSSRPSRSRAFSIAAPKVLVGKTAHDSLSKAADQAQLPLPTYLAGLIEDRLAAELIAPSPTWFAIPAQVLSISVPLPPKALTDIEELSSLTGQRQEVVVSNLVTGGPHSSAMELPLGYLRTEPGRGRIFGMYFEIPGYQYTLMRYLAGERLTNSRVMDLAFIALARQAATTGCLNEHPISDAARQFAVRMVMIESRRRSPSFKARA